MNGRAGPNAQCGRLRRGRKRTTVRCAPMMTIRFRRDCRRPLAIAVPLLLALAVSAAAQPPLALQPHDRVVLVGNTLAERQQLFNHFETLAADALPGARADGPQPRAGAATRRRCSRGRSTSATPPTHLTAQKADVILAFFGLNESFDGEAGVAAVRAGSRGLDRAPPRGALQRPSGAAPRAGVADRARAAGAAGPRRRRRAQPRARPLHRGDAVAGGASSTCRSSTCSRRRGRRWPPSPEPLTINGIHLNENGDRVFAGILMTALGFEPAPSDTSASGGQGLRHAARAGRRQEPALLLSLPSAQRRVRRRPPRRPVRVGELPRRDEAARRDGSPSRTSGSGAGPAAVAKGERRGDPAHGRRDDAALARRCALRAACRPRQAPGPRKEPNRGGDARPRVAGSRTWR